MTNQRKQLIVNRTLQLREAAGSAAMVIISVNLLLIIGSIWPELIRVSVNLPASGYLLVGLAEIALLAIVVVVSIRQSHRIAGPVYGIARDVRRMGEGDLTVQVRLRDHDEFREEADAINEAMHSIRVRVRSIKEHVASLSAATEPSERDRFAEMLSGELAELQTEEESEEANDDR